MKFRTVDTMAKKEEKDGQKEWEGRRQKHLSCEGRQIRTEAISHPHLESHTLCQIE